MWLALHLSMNHNKAFVFEYGPTMFQVATFKAVTLLDAWKQAAAALPKEKLCFQGSYEMEYTSKVTPE